MRIIICCLLLSLFVGCQQPLQIVVTQEEVPIFIEREGCFVTKTEFIKLISGRSIKYSNEKVGKYYLPANLISIKDKKVILKKVND